MKKAIRVIFILQIGILASCTPESTTTPVLETNAPAKIATRTPAPTDTPQPTRTPKYIFPTRMPSPTKRPTSTPFPFPTPEGMRYVRMSPDKKWIIWRPYDRGNFGPMVFQKFGGPRQWKVSAAELHPFYREDGTEYLNIYIDFWVAHWSGEGRYVYLKIQGCGDGSQYCRVYGLYRLDLETGRQNTVVENPGTFAISDNSRHLAYPRYDFNVLNMVHRNFFTGEETLIEISDPDIRGLAVIEWSPNAEKVLCLAQTDKGYYNYILIVDVKEGTYRIFFGDAFPINSAVDGWASDQEIRLKTRFGFYILNINSGELSD